MDRPLTTPCPLADKSDTASVELAQVQTAAVDNAGSQMHAQSQTAEGSMHQSRPVGPFKASASPNGAPVEHEPKLNTGQFLYLPGHSQALTAEQMSITPQGLPSLTHRLTYPRCAIRCLRLSSPPTGPSAS